MTTEKEGHYCIGRLFTQRFLRSLFNVHQFLGDSSTWWQE